MKLSSNPNDRNACVICGVSRESYVEIVSSDDGRLLNVAVCSEQCVKEVARKIEAAGISLTELPELKTRDGDEVVTILTLSCLKCAERPIRRDASQLVVSLAEDRVTVVVTCPIHGYVEEMVLAKPMEGGCEKCNESDPHLH